MKKKYAPKAQLQEPRQEVRAGSVAWIMEQERREKEESELFGGLRL